MGDAVDLMAAMVLEDEHWGEVAAPFQLDDARAVLEPEPESARLNWLSRSKGTSKTTDLAGMSLAWLVVQSVDLDEGYVIASDEEQANRLLNRARALIARTPGLRGVVEVQARSIVNIRNGARVVALAADVAGAEGLLSPWLALDELPNWADTASARGMWTAAFSSVPKVKGCRLTVIGHAGQPGSWQHRLFERARSSSAWRVNHLDGPAPWISAEALEEQRALLLPSQFERRWLNRWTQGEDRLALHEDVRACVQLDGPQEPRTDQTYVIGLDVGVTNDRCVAAVCHAEDLNPGDGAGERDERVARYMRDHGFWDRFTFDQRMTEHRARAERPVRVVLDRLAVWSGSRKSPVNLAEVEDWLRAASTSYGRAKVVFDPYQAAHLTQRLGAASVPVEQFTFSSGSVGKLAMTLHRLLRDRALVLPDDAALIEELAHVRLRETSPGVVRLDHDAGRHDDRVIAIALAAHELLSHPPSAAVVTKYRMTALRGTR